MIDFYRELRSPAYNSNLPATGVVERAGQFDPMLSVVVLSEALSNELDTQGGSLPLTSVEAGGSAAVAAYATSLHETVHWWQHIGSTIGLLTGLTHSAQAAMCFQYLTELDDRVPKPIVGVLKADRTRAPSDHPAWLAASRWREGELGAAFLVNPVRAFRQVRANPFLFESIGHAITLHSLSATWKVAETTDRDGNAVTRPEAWIDLYERSRTNGRPLFEVGTLTQIPFGARELFEGQARLTELQYRTRAVEPMTLAEARTAGMLEDVYYRCLAHLLETLGRPLPEDACSPTVNLFLLICDIAINPACGYPLQLPADWDLAQGNHPGLRFLQLCAAARDRIEELLTLLTTISLESYQRCAAILTETAGWPTPDAVAREACELLSRTTQWAALQHGREEGDLGVEEVPVRLILAEHGAFSEMKAELPHFFCWPAYFLTVDDDTDGVFAFQTLLKRFSPPFLASSRDSGVDSFALEGISKQQATTLASRYFMTQAIVELCRQWIAEPGPFRFDFTWKPVMQKTDVTNLKASFRSNIGRSLDDIPFVAREELSHG